MKNTAVLLINCPDRKGVVAAVADFLYKHNANILHADEHQDSEMDLFFLRTEWDLDDFRLSKDKFETAFKQIAKKFQMDWQLKYTKDKSKVAVFLSKEDHCLADLLYRHKNNELNCDISLIISNCPNAKDLAGFYGIPFYQISGISQDKSDTEKKILKLMKKII